MNGSAAWQGIYGAWRLACRDRGAPRYFDGSLAGVLRSFWAGAICYPGFFLLLWMRPDTPGGGAFLHALIIQTIGYVIQWAAYPLAALPFCRWLVPEERALGFIAAYNWSQVLQTAFFVLVALISLPLPDSGALALGRIGLVAMLGYEWFIARVAIGAGGWVAAGMVVLDVVLGSFIVIITESLY